MAAWRPTRSGRSPGWLPPSTARWAPTSSAGSASPRRRSGPWAGGAGSTEPRHASTCSLAARRRPIVDLRVGLLCLGAEAVVSHEAAARLHRFDRCLLDAVEFTVPRRAAGSSCRSSSTRRPRCAGSTGSSSTASRAPRRRGRSSTSPMPAPSGCGWRPPSTPRSAPAPARRRCWLSGSPSSADRGDGAPASSTSCSWTPAGTPSSNAASCP